MFTIILALVKGLGGEASIDIEKGQMWTQCIDTRIASPYRNVAREFISKTSYSMNNFAKQTNELHWLSHNVTDMISLHAMGQQLWRHFQRSGWAITYVVSTLQTPIQRNKFYSLFNSSLPSPRSRDEKSHQTYHWASMIKGTFRNDIQSLVINSGQEKVVIYVLQHKILIIFQ
jgi:hypothetical protein